jgi:hypothetical protein
MFIEETFVIYAANLPVSCRCAKCVKYPWATSYFIFMSIIQWCVADRSCSALWINLDTLMKHELLRTLMQGLEIMKINPKSFLKTIRDLAHNTSCPLEVYQVNWRGTSRPTISDNFNERLLV